MKLLFVSTVYSARFGGRESVLYKISHELAKDNEVQVVARFNKANTYWTSLKRFLASSPQRVNTYKSYNHMGDKYVSVAIPGLSFFEKVWLLPVYKLHFHLRTQFLAIWMFNMVWEKKLYEFVKWSDIVEFHGTGFELLGHSVARVCKLTHKPFVVLPHVHTGTWGDCKTDISLYKKADAIISKTNYEKQFLMAKGLSCDKIEIIPNAPLVSNKHDAKYFREKYKINNRNMILFIGRKSKDKGYDVLVQAMDLVWRVRSDTYFVFIGRGEVKTESDKRIIELGWVDEYLNCQGVLCEKASALVACDVFCMPSYAEAFGIAYTEAWVFGKPVIGGDIPVLREIISHGIDGLLVTQNRNIIANTILKLLGDNELRIKLGKAGKKKVEKEFNWNIIINMTKELYVKLLKE